jgi:mannose-1-phosphate guanylyltransferase
MAIKTFLLAAGLGTRLRPYTHTIPKPCIPFLGSPMMSYGLFLSEQSGFKDIVINTHLLAPSVQSCANTISRGRLRIEFSHETPKPLGSGGALWGAKKNLSSSTHFFVINGDNIFIPKDNLVFERLLLHHQQSSGIATLLVSRDPQLVSQFNPLWVNKSNCVVGVGKHPPESIECSPVHYMGLKVFNSEILQHVPADTSNIFTDILLPLIQKGEVVSTLTEPSVWWETGDFDSFLSATKSAMTLIHQTKDNGFFKKISEWQGRPFEFHQQLKGENVIFSHVSNTFPLLQLQGTVFADSGVQLKPHVHVKNSILNKNSHLSNNIQNEMCFGEQL